MNKILKSILRPPHQFVRRITQLWHKKNETDRLLHIPNNISQPKIFYLGITEHSNLGDLCDMQF